MKASTSILLIILILALIVFPLIFVNGEYGGSDDQAEGVISDVDPEYTPWFSSFFEPASGEIESLLFASQAAFGAGIICFALGYMKGKKKSAADR